MENKSTQIKQRLGSFILIINYLIILRYVVGSRSKAITSEQESTADRREDSTCRVVEDTFEEEAEEEWRGEALFCPLGTKNSVRYAHGIVDHIRIEFKLK